MIRLFKHYVPLPILLLALTEAAVLFACMYLGTALRFVGGEHGDFQSVGPIFPRAVVFTAVMLSIMTAFGLHQRQVKQEGEWGYPVRFVASFVVGLVAMMLFFYAVPDLHLGRGAFGLVFLFALAGTAVARFVFMRVFKLDMMQRRVLLLGAGSRSAKVEMLERDHKGHRKFNLVGCLPLNNSECCLTKTRVFHDQTSILAVAKKYRIDEIVVGVRERRNGGLPADQLLECKLAGVEILDLPSFFERETGQIQLESLNPSWMIFSDGFTRGSLKDMSKRMFDIGASSILLLLTLPVMLITALLIKLESRGPIFYRQERVGEYGRSFGVLKFRSMRTDAERDGVPQWAKKHDNRVTRVGRVIRKLRIDELPQVFNVFRGDMSFVGPRPERPFFVKELTAQIPYYPSRHTVKPGITGWAQICYPYGATVEDAVQKLQYDLYYVKNHTLFLDLIILFQTAQVVIFGQGAR
ncbi:MAG: TIGR03013 family PEP-CTERM/XrtA system glycosyltransferase [Gammaproteobacteria bacterium]|nr:TIGR03013 family PEP-CTERM/XrtA system glycosyltransferase [Gammaproteobacteria bacterium]